jgi:uncharacterized membrane protein
MRRLAFEAALVLVLAAAAAWGVSVLPGLPERVPVHFGPDGTADGFAARGPGAVLMLPVVGLGLNGLLGAIGWAILRHRAHLRRIAGHEGAAAGVRAEQARITERFVSIVRAGLVLDLAAMQVVTLRAAEAGRLHPGWMGLAIGLPLTAVVVGLVYQAAQTAELRRAAASAGAPDPWPDAPGWRAGGLIYADPGDPRLLVEKRWGIGWTLNFGRPIAWLLLGLLLGEAALVLAVALLAG